MKTFSSILLVKIWYFSRRIKSIISFILLFYVVNYSKAQIIYTDIEPDEYVVFGMYPGYYNLDLNNDGIEDFQFYFIYTNVYPPNYQYDVNVRALHSDAFISSYFLEGCVYAEGHQVNDVIGNNCTWTNGSNLASYGTYPTVCMHSGSFLGGYDRFVGLKLIANNITYFGWLRIDVSPQADMFVVREYAINNAEIIAASNSIIYPPIANAGPDKTICYGSSTTLTASGGVNYFWNTGSTATTLTVSPIVNTTYTVTVMNVIGSTASDEVVVLVNPAVNPQIYGSLNYNSGGYATLSTDNYPIINWSTGAHNTQSVNVTSLNNPISVSVIDNQGCMGTSNPVNVVQNAPLNTIQGAVSYSGGNVAASDGVVNLFQFGPNGHHQLVDAIDIGTNGSFVFNNIPNGEYYLYVKINNDGYPYQNVKNSYFDSTYRWQDARPIHIDNGNTNVALHLYETNIQLVGNATISGIVNYINHNQNKFNKNYLPVEGANIYIMPELAQEITASDVTLSDGSYKICSIPDGTYNMYVDFSGFPLIETYTNIQVNNNSAIFPEMNFYVDTTLATAGIYTDEATKTKIFESEQISLNVFPNPVSDIITIEYFLKNQGIVCLELLDLTGRKQVIQNSSISAKGSHHKEVNLKEMNLNKGIYFFKMLVDNNVYLKKIVIQ